MTDWQIIKQHLVKNDKRLACLIASFGQPTFLSQRAFEPNLFDQLINSIISQQLSTKVARTLKDRLYRLLESTEFVPSALSEMETDVLRSCGLSYAKSSSIQSIAKVLTNNPTYLSDLADKENHEITTTLTQLKGVGTWTAQMFQMFALNRLDVFAPGDAGLMKGIRIIYFQNKPPNTGAVEKVTAKWKPYRSIGSWYMWQVANTR
tara:strand:- start:9574 stop:10191 length:618 start_codon:yes stop_codon:yes gene_type:complete